ncbi:MAG: 1-aminocyclopropane-1-carboxylate deaminase [bacterium]|jgi:1-aminocyclopropane-1-carboxylate deaminase
MIKLSNTPIEQIKFKGHSLFLKRDDLLHPFFSGNKARKLYFFLINQFPKLEKVTSYGSSQSNLLYSLSALSRLQNWKCDFYVDRIPSWLKEQPRGNYKAALENKVNIISLQNIKTKLSVEEYVQQKFLTKNDDELLIPEGGRCQEAEFGVKQLAKEILEWQQAKKVQNLKIYLPSGTGTTALFLQKNLPFEIFTCACVGGNEYLKKQFFELSKNQQDHPIILDLKRKYHFGKLYDDFYLIWNELQKETGIEFELLYDPLGWLVLLEHISQLEKENGTILYIHQGGLKGNETMIPRYKRKYYEC